MNKHPFLTLESDRLVLRMLKTRDHNELFRLRSDPGINKYLDRPPAESIQDAIEFINKIKQGTKDKDWIYWAITLKSQDRLIGTICLSNFSENRDQAEVGFELLPQYQSKGIIQESIACIIKYGFETLNLSTISATVHHENSKSIYLLKKFQFIPDPDKRGVESQEVRYILSSEDYK